MFQRVPGYLSCEPHCTLVIVITAIFLVVNAFAEKDNSTFHLQNNVRKKRIVVDPAQTAAEVNQAIAACHRACTRTYVLQLTFLGRFCPTLSTLAFFYKVRRAFFASSASRCHLNCQNLNQCVSGAADCVPTLSTCEPTLGGFSCRCNTGFSGDGRTGMDASGCQDIDECTTGDNNCDANADCTNTEGSFMCTCRTGFTGDGVMCNDIDECATGDICNSNTVCTNTEGGFTCRCLRGFDTVNFNDQGVVCEDIDECDQGDDNCGANTICVNIPGSFNCISTP